MGITSGAGEVRDRRQPAVSSAPRPAPIGVGIVGLSAGGGWGAGAHLPAMSATGEFELRGLVASSGASAHAASQTFGVPAYASVRQLAHAHGVELVVITVKTPRHRELILPALEAGRAVFAEWPLALDRPEAQEMVDAARGVPTFVGLHGRSSPTLRWSADLVADGYVGEVLSATVSSTVTEWGGPVAERQLYTLDRELGATMLSIAFGHAIDVASTLVGELQDVVATTTTRHRRVPLEGTSESVPMTADDQIAISGTLPGGAVLSAHQRGGAAGGAHFSMVVDGTDGTLEITAPNHPHVTQVSVRGARRGDQLATLAPPAGDDRFPQLAGTVIHSLAHAYADIPRALRGEPTTVPDFAAAERRHRLLDGITRSAVTGRRIQL